MDNNIINMTPGQGVESKGYGTFCPKENIYTSILSPMAQQTLKKRVRQNGNQRWWLTTKK